MPRHIPREHAWYEQRYRAVYAAGVACATGREPGSERHYRAFLESDPTRGQLLDLGCGEGFLSAVAANLGYQVLGVDSAPSAIVRARQVHPHPNLQYLLADVCQLDDLPAESFDIIADLGCFHLLVDDEDARQCLRHVFRLLKPGGRAYYQNLVPTDDAEAWFPDKLELVARWREHVAQVATMKTRTATYHLDGRTVEVDIPVIPSAKRDLRRQVALLSEAGIAVHSARVVTPGLNSPFEAILIACKLPTGDGGPA